MLKKSYMRLLVLIVATISSMVVVTILLLESNKTMDYILSVLSISVTLILGVTTYFQVETQKKIDMIDKTPSLKFIFFKEDLEIDEKDIVIRDEFKLYTNRQYCRVVRFGESKKNALLKIDFVNNSNVIIQKAEFFEINVEQGKRDETKILNYKAETAITDNIYKKEVEFLKELNGKLEPGVYWNVNPSEHIQVYLKVPYNADEIKKELIIYIKTIHDYDYIEKITLNAQKCGYSISKGIIYLVNKCDVSVEWKS